VLDLEDILEEVSGQLHGGRFTAGDRTHETHWIGGWVGPRVGLDAVARRKILSLCRETNRGDPARSLVSMLTELLLGRLTPTPM